MSDGHLLPALSPADARLVDQACDRFEAAWKAAQRPDAQEHLGATVGAVRSALLRQLLLLDWEYRRRAGDEPHPEDYHRRFPGDTAMVEDVRREMSEAADSTQKLCDEGGAGCTPASGEAALDLAGDAVAPTEAGSARYELLQEIGQGGIGIVFRGRDRHLGRELAVKVLREAYRDRPEARHRFLEEARVGSQLQHPAIVPVYEQGWFSDRRPYLTMKLVEGHTLAALLKERADPGADLPRLLGTFEQVCQAIGYAHARGVVHRDLKPANIMVGGFGEVQVMDWGFAKVLGGSGTAPGATISEEIPRLRVGLTDGASGPVTMPPNRVSHSGMVLGTPAYMPPEQARGEGTRIDPRADVFALGAILCEILTGSPPYVGATAEEVCGKAAEGSLTEAYARLDSCGADAVLRELARRCLAPERRTRPADAGVVARDFAAYLASAQERHRQAQLERVKAEARSAELRRRRRLLLTAAGLLALVLLAGMSVSLWQMRRAIEARDDETKARQQAFTALRSMTADVVERKFAQGTVLTEDDRAFLRGVIAQFDAFAEIKADDADSRAARAEGRFRVGKMRHRLGELQEAEQDFGQALAIRTQLAADFPSRPEFRHDLAQSHLYRGILLFAMSRLKEAEQDFEQSLSILQQLAADIPSRPEFRQDLAKSHHRRGVLLRATGRIKEAEQDFEQALSIFKQLAADFPTRLEFRQELSGGHTNRGNLLQETGRLQEAEKDYDEAVSIRKQLADDFPSRHDFRQDLAYTHVNRGALRHIAGRLKEAEQDYDRAVSLHQELAADFPSLPEFREALALSYSNRGELHSAMDQLPQAERDFSQARSLWKQLAADFPTRPKYRRDLAYIENNLGRLLARQKRFAEAFSALNAALARGKELVEADPKNLEYTNVLGYSHAYRGWALVRSGQPSQAAADLRRALELFAKEPAPNGDVRFERSHVLALLAGLGGEKNSGVTPAEAAGFADQAVAALRDAVRAGWGMTGDLKQPDFDALRGRDDFKKLLAELEGKGK
jgi:serine/threonine protein kinase/Flp pilus assembly protein TadD